MRFARKIRLLTVLAATSASLVLAAPPASAATITVQNMTGSGTTIGADVQKAVLGINMTGSGTFQGVDVELTDDGGFDLTDLRASPDGVAVYADDGAIDDALDSEDTRVSTGFTSTGLSLDVTVDAAIPESASGDFNFFLTVRTSPSITEGDAFTVEIPSPLLGCAFTTSPATLLCSGATSGAITAETTAPTAQLTSTPSTLDGNVVWTFSENVVGVSGSNVVLRLNGSSTNIAASVTYNAESRSATINPNASLSPGATYRTIVNPGSATDLVTDEAGNAVDTTEGTFSFADIGFTAGVVRGNVWYLSTGPNRTVDEPFGFGLASDLPIAGDWDGEDGRWEVGVVRGNVWHIANETPPQTVTSFGFGKATDFPIVGDWDGNGSYTPGVVRGNLWIISNQMPPVTVTSFSFGKSTDFPIVGDWDGNGTTTPGVVRGNTWFLSNQLSSTPSSVTTFAFGKSTDFPIVGDWDDDGKWTVGVVRSNVWFLAQDSPPTAVTTFAFGRATDFPIVGDWEGPGASAGGAALPDIVPGAGS